MGTGSSLAHTLPWGRRFGIAAQKKQTSVAINAVSRVAMYALNLAVPVLVGPYVARVLNVETYGAYNAAQSVMQLFLALASFGVYTYGMRQASRVRDDLGKTRTVFEPLYRFGVLAAVVSWLLFTVFVLLFQKDQQTLYLILGLQVLFNAYSVEWVNEAFEDYPFILFKTAAARLIYLAAVFLFVRREQDAAAFALVSSLSVLLNHVFGFLYIRRRVKRRKTRLSELKPFVKPLAVTFLLSNANILYLMLDRLYLSAFAKDKAYITYYTLPMLIMSAVMNVVSSLLYVTVPRLSNKLAQDDEAGYKSLLSASAHTFFLVAMPVCAGIGALGEQMMLLYGGKAYMAAGPTLMLFGLRYMVNACDISLYNQILFPHSMEKTLLKIYVGGGILNLALKAVLFMLNIFDPAICIATTCVSDIAVVAFEQRAVRKRFEKGLSPLDFATLRYAALSLLFYPVCAFLRLAFPLSDTLDKAFFSYLLAAVLSCAALYAAALYFIRDRHFKELLQRISARLKRKYTA